MKKISFPALGDCIVPGLILAQAIGRWGNFVNVEAFGSVTDVAWRMSSPSIAQYLANQITAQEYQGIIDGTLGVHPTFFYESFWNIIGFIAINFFYKHKKYDGQIILLVFGWYGLGRAWIEGLRTDSLYIPGTAIRVSQLLAIIIFAACLGLLIYFAIKPPKTAMYFREKPVVADGAEVKSVNEAEDEKPDDNATPANEQESSEDEANVEVHTQGKE